MSCSAGTGSPVWFLCHRGRSTLRSVGRRDHRVKLTGRMKKAPRRRHHAMGSRSTPILREYECSCGHVGWSNHVDLADLAGHGKYDQIEIVDGVPRITTPSYARGRRKE